jgi:hypothetical protein
LIVRRNRCLHRGFLVLVAFLGVFGLQPVAADSDEDDEVRPWQEVAVQLPAAPLQENLLPFYVSAATNNEFYVDGASLSVGADGVVRYVLVVQTQGGARNVTYEGLRCETKERRLYASGRPDGTWARSRNDEWRRIQNMATNRHHAALIFDYFCPSGAIVRDVAEARDALLRGGHPNRRKSGLDRDL